VTELSLSAYLHSFVDHSYDGLTGNIEQFAGLDMLTHLDLQGTRVEGDLSALTGLPLAYLNLVGTAVTGDLSELSQLPLTHLALGGTAVTGDLSELSHLQWTYLSLGSTSVTGDISALSSMPLTYLTLIDSPAVTGNAPQALDAMPLTDWLSLARTRVTGCATFCDSHGNMDEGCQC
jgi:hypothetical protein